MSTNRSDFVTESLRPMPHFAYWGDLDLSRWGVSPIGVHRDSDALSRSNWEVITNDLMAKFPDAFDILPTSHCLVGWYDHLMFDTQDTAATDALIEWCDQLENYPVANEDHFSDLEYEEAWDWIVDTYGETWAEPLWDAYLEDTGEFFNAEYGDCGLLDKLFDDLREAAR